MPSTKQLYGRQAEGEAATFLCRRGFRLIARHVTCRYGEIDLIMVDGPTIVAVEVKARRSNRYGQAVESITATKLNRLAAALVVWQERQAMLHVPTRIDAVVIDGRRIEHLKDLTGLQTLPGT